MTQIACNDERLSLRGTFCATKQSHGWWMGGCFAKGARNDEKQGRSQRREAKGACNDERLSLRGAFCATKQSHGWWRGGCFAKGARNDERQRARAMTNDCLCEERSVRRSNLMAGGGGVASLRALATTKGKGRVQRRMTRAERRLSLRGAFCATKQSHGWWRGLLRERALATTKSEGRSQRREAKGACNDERLSLRGAPCATKQSLRMPVQNGEITNQGRGGVDELANLSIRG